MWSRASLRANGEGVIVRTGRARAVGSGVQVAIGLGLWNLGNYAFFLIAGRVLGPADYGLVAALLAAVLVVQTPFTSLQTALARVVGGYGGDATAGLYRTCVRRALIWTPPVAVLAALGVVVAGGMSGEVPVGPLLATIMILLPVAVFPLGLGQLQGEHRFTRYSISMAAFGLPRPLFLLALVAAGLGVYAALLGTAAATMLAAAAVLCFTADRLRGPAVRSDPDLGRAMGASLTPLVAGVAAVALLSNLDVIVAKLALDPVDAGLFASAAVLAKTVFLVPQAITIVLLPHIAARRAQGRSTSELLTLALVITLAVGALATLVALAFAEPIMRITFGPDFVGGADLLAPLTGAMTLVGTMLILLYHQVALGSYRVAWTLLTAAGVLALGLAAFHGSPQQIIAVDAAVSGTVLLLHDLVGRGTGDRIALGLAGLVRRARARA